MSAAPRVPWRFPIQVLFWPIVVVLKILLKIDFALANYGLILPIENYFAGLRGFHLSQFFDVFCQKMAGILF